jgi:hypothetical protein
MSLTTPPAVDLESDPRTTPFLKMTPQIVVPLFVVNAGLNPFSIKFWFLQKMGKS